MRRLDDALAWANRRIEATDFATIPDRLLYDLAAVDAPDPSLPVPPQASPGDHVTERELELLKALAHGLTMAMVADLYGISVETVKEELKNVRYRLRAKNTTHAVAIALRRGLI